MLARAPLVQKAEARVDSLPAPIGGWNARDSLANMPSTDAVYMTNLFPGTASVALRGGYQQFATGLNGQVQTLMWYAGATTSEFYAIDSIGLSIYNVSAGGPVPAPVVTGLTNAIWEYSNISTPGGNFLEAVNGEDYLELYDGTNWTQITGSSSPAITNVDTRTLSNIELFKDRMWFIQKGTLTAWYLPTQSVGGAAEEFDLGSVARRGGYLVDIATWTIDAGYGLDDNLVFITSNGEVIVYAGTDPASSTTFALIGVFQLGAPIGNRPLFKWAGDLLVLTYDGLLPLAAAIQSSRLDPRVALSNKIQNAISAATTQFASNFGWQIFYYAKENAVWVNVPMSDGTTQQYVMNTITKSWCNFSGWNANCWELFNDNSYFGGNGYVGLAWTPDYEDSGSNINTACLQAFNYFDARGTQKYFTRARPTIFTNGSPAISIGLNVDFSIETNLTPLNFTGTSVSLWDVALWDVGLWGSSSIVTNNWQGITGIGYCGAIQFQSASMGLSIEWASTDVVYQAGWAGI